MAVTSEVLQLVKGRHADLEGLRSGRDTKLTEQELEDCKLREEWRVQQETALLEELGRGDTEDRQLSAANLLRTMEIIVVIDRSGDSSTHTPRPQLQKDRLNALLCEPDLRLQEAVSLCVHYAHEVFLEQLTVQPPSDKTIQAHDLYNKLLSRNKRIHRQIEAHANGHQERASLRAELHRNIEQEYLKNLEDEYVDYKRKGLAHKLKQARSARVIWRGYLAYKQRQLHVKAKVIQRAVRRFLANRRRLKARLRQVRVIVAKAKLVAWYPTLVARWRGRNYHPKFLKIYDSHLASVVLLQSWFRGSIARNGLYWRWVFAHHRSLRRSLYLTKRQHWRAADPYELRLISTYSALETERQTLEAYKAKQLAAFDAKWSAYEAKLEQTIERNFNKTTSDWIKVGEVWINAKKQIEQRHNPVVEIKAKNKQKLRTKALEKLLSHLGVVGETHESLVVAFEAKAPAVLGEVRRARCELIN
jgi:hypothetical protein